MDARTAHMKFIWGILILIVAFFIATVQNVLVKLVSYKVPISSILFFQYCICAVLCLPVFYRKKKQILRTRNLSLLLIRAIAGLIYYFFMFYALHFTQLTNVALLSNTAPLWIPILGLVFLRNKIKPITYIAIIIGFVGVAFILTPHGSVVNEGSIFALLAGFAMAIALLAVKRLSDQEPIERVLFFYFFIAALVMLPISLGHWQHLSAHLWLIIIANGILMFFQQVLIYLGFKLGPANKLSIATYSAVIFSVFFDWLIWEQVITIPVIIGAALIIFAAICVLIPPKLTAIFVKNNKNQAAKPNET